MKNTNNLKESCQKNVVLMKTKNKTFLTYLDKMQFSAILCLATNDWFCADGSHIERQVLLVYWKDGLHINKHGKQRLV